MTLVRARPLSGAEEERPLAREDCLSKRSRRPSADKDQIRRQEVLGGSEQRLAGGIELLPQELRQELLPPVPAWKRIPSRRRMHAKEDPPLAAWRQLRIVFRQARERALGKPVSALAQELFDFRSRLREFFLPNEQFARRRSRRRRRKFRPAARTAPRPCESRKSVRHDNFQTLKQQERKQLAVTSESVARASGKPCWASADRLSSAIRDGRPYFLFRSGRRIVKVVPTCGVLSTLIEPL